MLLACCTLPFWASFHALTTCKFSCCRSVSSAHLVSLTQPSPPFPSLPPLQTQIQSRRAATVQSPAHTISCSYHLIFNSADGVRGFSERQLRSTERAFPAQERGFSSQDRVLVPQETGSAIQERGHAERADLGFLPPDRGLLASSGRGLVSKPERAFATQPSPGFFHTAPTAYDQPGGFTKLGGGGAGKISGSIRGEWVLICV